MYIQELCVDLFNRPASLYNAFLDKILSSKYAKKVPSYKEKEKVLELSCALIRVCKCLLEEPLEWDQFTSVGHGVQHMGVDVGMWGRLDKTEPLGKEAAGHTHTSARAHTHIHERQDIWTFKKLLKREERKIKRAFCSFSQEHTDKMRNWKHSDTKTA